MRKGLIIFLAIALFSCRTANNEEGKEELRKLLNAYYEAMAKKDLETMKSLTANNFIYYDEGTIHNNETAFGAVEHMPAFTATFKFDSLNAYISDKNASAYYLREAVFTMEGRTYPAARYLESATFSKEGKDWKIRFLHSTMRK